MSYFMAHQSMTALTMYFSTEDILITSRFQDLNEEELPIIVEKQISLNWRLPKLRKAANIWDLDYCRNFAVIKWRSATKRERCVMKEEGGEEGKGTSLIDTAWSTETQDTASATLMWIAHAAISNWHIPWLTDIWNRAWWKWVRLMRKKKFCFA